MMVRAILLIAVLGLLGLLAYAYVKGATVQDIANGKIPGLTMPSMPHNPPDATPTPSAPVAQLAAKAIMIAGKRIDVSGQWTSEGGQAYLESLTIYFMKQSGEIVRQIPFEIREQRTGYDLSSRFPLEPEADLFGICAVYGASKDAQKLRASAVFANKGVGEASDMKASAGPDEDKTGGCFAGS